MRGDRLVRWAGTRHRRWSRARNQEGKIFRRSSRSDGSDHWISLDSESWQSLARVDRINARNKKLTISLVLMPDVDDSEHNSLQDTHNDDNDDNDNVKLSGDTSDHQPDPGPASAGTSSTPAPVLLSDTPSDRLPSPITINSTCTNDLSLMPSLLSPILRCPLCKLPFISPTTLHCGHTICSTHLQDKCPIPSCHRSDKPLNPNIPQSSTVTFSPAESPPPLPPPTSSSRVDVTISKIISLVSHVEADLENIDEASDRDDDDHDDDDAPTTPFPSSSSRVRPRRNSSASPPRVRKRRRYTQKSDDEDDLLSHLRKQSVVQRSTPHDEPLLPSQLPSIRIDILSRFEKNILTELTCDICCTLFYQPLTTPCQHVRPSMFVLSFASNLSYRLSVQSASTGHSTTVHHAQYAGKTSQASPIFKTIPKIKSYLH